MGSERKIEYTLKRNPRARGLRLVVSGDGSVRVSAPLHLSKELIEQFILQKASWVMRKIDACTRVSEYTLSRNTKRDFDAQKNAALDLVKARISEWNRVYGFPFRRITIKNLKTRWGSCSKKGNLNFHYQVIRLPARLVDYLVVHELCHLRELNHSKRFWNLVAQTIPDYSELRRELKRYRMSF